MPSAQSRSCLETGSRVRPAPCAPARVCDDAAVDRRLCVLALLAALSAGAPGCSPQAPPAGADPRSRPTASGEFRVSYTPSPDPIPLNEYFTLKLTVRDRAGAPADAIEVDADMPSHNHGMLSAPAVSRQGPGEFLAEGMLFHMPGDWELYVDVQTEGGPQRVVFPIFLEHQ